MELKLWIMLGFLNIFKKYNKISKKSYAKPITKNCKWISSTMYELLLAQENTLLVKYICILAHLMFLNVNWCKNENNEISVAFYTFLLHNDIQYKRISNLSNMNTSVFAYKWLFFVTIVCPLRGGNHLQKCHIVYARIVTISFFVVIV